ncbi:MAG TPA: hypothetical protein PK364_13400 [Synergistaceae bacterium]|nr:hypothetical protein [Synergistaceae bacterium]
MQEKDFLEKRTSFQVDTFGIFIMVVIACIMLGTVGILFASRRGEPEVKRHVADLQAMEQALEQILSVSPDISFSALSLMDLEKGMERSLETSRYSLGILSEDAKEALFVGVKILSDPGVREMSAKCPEDLGPLFWAGQIGSAAGRNGGELKESLYPLKDSPRERSPQWVYLLVREKLRQ